MSTKVIFYVMDVTDVVFSAFLIYHFFFKENRQYQCGTYHFSTILAVTFTKFSGGCAAK